ncbi:MAG TPA: MerR family transcriptional regulator [Actinophytocola sp.]|uniref:MerR family transcriptional regulator n=1 Tax=Actinophytocola sp. TaxID=1872138 RepID=UPI002DDD1DAC|nr:MerR family transcriptional regulator [Actinophytocola sp.]HEV2778330.1 MerR family transcriptional regulator [Actinophytocola sp.]
MTELIPIGEAAEKLSMNTSALRYYEERGLVAPAERRGGKRMYGRAELRRLALIQLAHRLGVPLDTVGAIMDAPNESWRDTVRAQIAALDELIAQAQGAKNFLSHALQCPSAHPIDECPVMIGVLDDLVAGKSVERVAAEHT